MSLYALLSSWLFAGRGKEDWIETYSGGRYYPGNPRAQDVNIIDIAHHLSMECRFTGAVRRFYSVAEHSLYVSRLVPPEHALVGLMHDATEAYLKDIARPLKHQLPDYKKLERLNWSVIAPVFGLPLVLPHCVHEADNAMLAAERAALMPDKQGRWAIEGTPAKIMVWGLPPEIAEREFLNRFRELTKGRSFTANIRREPDLAERFRHAEGLQPC